MDARHQEYAAYYSARAKRYAARPLYTETTAAENAMAACINDAPTLEAWGEEMQRRNLNVACAVALSRDHARAELQLYDAISEPVRSAGPKRILAELQNSEGLTAADVASKVAAILDDNSKAIAVDELVTSFHGSLDILEEQEIYATAEIPAEWRDRWNRVAADDMERGRTLWREVTLPNNRVWDPTWIFDESKIAETRFRRRIPMPDAVVARRLTQYRAYRGESA